jgi:hypothetical protein
MVLINTGKDTVLIFYGNHNMQILLFNIFKLTGYSPLSRFFLYP